MINRIKYFEEEYINSFEKLEAEFMKEPLKREEYEVLCSAQVLQSVNKRHGVLEKYTEIINHSMWLQNRKKVYFNFYIWGLFRRYIYTVNTFIFKYLN